MYNPKTVLKNSTILSQVDGESTLRLIYIINS